MEQKEPLLAAELHHPNDTSALMCALQILTSLFHPPTPLPLALGFLSTPHRLHVFQTVK